MYELISTILKIEDIYKLKEAFATGIVVGESFHGTRLTKAFNLQEIREINTICEKLSLKLYIKMNRIYLDEEFRQAEKYLMFLKQLTVEGIFFNDLGLYGIAKNFDMHNKLIYDPDTIVTNHYDVNYHLNKGLYGVVLSKEITKEEMMMIAEKAIGKVGVIIHGYLNMSYSKRDLITNYFEFINKSFDIKGKRDLYLIEENREGKMPIIEDEQGTMVFTDYIQESFDEVQELYASGVKMFIVDGIFLDSQVVIDAVEGYSELLSGSIKDIKTDYLKKYEGLPFSTGYMEKATNLVK